VRSQPPVTLLQRSRGAPPPQVLSTLILSALPI